jgi:hypothetical protein
MGVSKKSSKRPVNIIFLPLVFFGAAVVVVIVGMGVGLATGIEKLLKKIF